MSSGLVSAHSRDQRSLPENNKDDLQPFFLLHNRNAMTSRGTLLQGQVLHIKHTELCEKGKPLSFYLPTVRTPPFCLRSVHSCQTGLRLWGVLQAPLNSAGILMKDQLHLTHPHPISLRNKHTEEITFNT